ncbi:hypothetical protein LNTAR_19482 [Lentisphaera araneosa HTCC2155]|uniref:Uncharacterized protein n=1 Tax=Lentisphaera araneosa HTCC2155 TaxID=313628 RepID=A6DQW2_9BACT|nr:hypothetical protein [Lentisphaera araneosa]EDM26012.1 hypothetical protein LNTAR_19482 [Lentisphaera araneosa HTCC2155]
MKKYVVFMFVFAAFSLYAENKHKNAAEERQKKKESMSSKEWKEFLKEEKAKREAIKAKREAKKKKQDVKKSLHPSGNDENPMIQKEKQTQLKVEEEAVEPKVQKATKKIPGVIKPTKVGQKIFI